jgi:hypothetical protein
MYGPPLKVSELQMVINRHGIQRDVVLLGYRYSWLTLY